MKKHQTLAAVVLAFAAVNAYSQSSQKQPGAVQTGATQVEITGYESQLAKLQSEWSEAKVNAEKMAGKARISAQANRIAARKLAEKPSDKSLANQATALAKTAQKEAREARKAADELARLEKGIAELKSKITENQAFVGSFRAPVTDTVLVRAPGGEVPVAIMQAAPEVTAGSNDARNVENAEGIVGKVLAQTYQRYPQNGQPAIIINNIVVPPDYKQNSQGGSEKTPAYEFSEEEFREYQAFKMRQKDRKALENGAFDNSGASAPAQAAAPQKLSFTQRFGEINRKRSGVWVIPMVGIHASNFDADFSNDKLQGRSGWNAGLDFRAHQKKFFIQPGVHYFSSSIEVTDKDSLSNAPLLKGPRIHILKVPLLAGFYLTRESGAFLKINVKGGVTGNYVISVDKNSLARFSKDNMEAFSYGLNAGLGIELGLLTIDLSHEWGMSPLFKDDRSKSNVLRATLGVKI